MTRTRLTKEGKGALALSGLIALIALQTGNNLVYMVTSVLWSIMLLAPLFARWNLRGLEVRRVLPEEFFVRAEARGAFVLENTRSWLPAMDVTVLELDHPSTEVTVQAVEPNGQSYAPAGWSFSARGHKRLGDVLLSSSFPFGLVLVERELECEARLTIYPRPKPGLWTTEAGELGSDEGAGRSVGAFGDFSSLRPYVPGDSIRAIHWPTTARSGQPVVVVRTGEGARQIVIKVTGKSATSWEVEISKATGQLLRAFSNGCAVGLQLPTQYFDVRTGGSWRRDLLEALATLEERP